MARKSKLRGIGGPGTGFFAFQDIITTVIAFVLLNILFQITLTRGLIDTATTPASKGSKDDTRNRIAQLEGELKTLQETYGALATKISTSATTAGGASNQAIAATLDTNRAALAEKVEMLERKLAELATALGADAAAIVSEAIRKEIESSRSALAKAREDETALELRRADLRKETIDLQQRVADALKRLRTLWVIAEATNTSKTPIFGIVSADKLEWFRVGDKSARATNRPSDWSGGSLRVNDHPATDYYAVLYFRPSAAPYFEDLIKALRDSRYEVGYDVVPENQELVFTVR